MASVSGVAAVDFGGLVLSAVGRIDPKAEFTFGGLDLAVDVALHAVTGTATIVLGAAGVEADGTTPIPGIVLTATAARPSLALFAADWRTKLASLHSQDFAFRDEFTAAGSITFSLRLDDPALAQTSPGRLVKAYWKGHSRVASPLRKSTTKLAVDRAATDRAWRTWDSQADVKGAIQDGIVLPEYGIERAAGDNRTAGYMSLGDELTDGGTWTRAVALPFADDTGHRAGVPSVFKGLGASWIAKHGPYAIQAPTHREWLFIVFRTYTAFEYEIVDAVDDNRELWLDDEQLGFLGDNGVQSYSYVGRVTGRLPAGLHKWAVQVDNLATGRPNNPVAYIGVMRRLHANGDPVKGPPFLTTSSRWLAADNVQGVHKAHFLLKMWQENAAWPIGAFRRMHTSWTRDRDSSGQAWSDAGRLTQPIARGLLDVFQEYGEQSFDHSVDADTLTHRLHKRLGTDRSATVTLELGVAGGSLKTYEVTRTEARYNAGLLHLDDNTWTLREDPSVTDDNRAAIGLSMGSTAWVSTANAVADAQFDETAHVTREFQNVEVSLNRGPQLYEQFWTGDSVMGRDEDGSDLKVRIMAATVKVSEDVVQVFLDLVEDRSA